MEKTQYDPNKSYQWLPQSDIQILGSDFDHLQRFTHAYINNMPQLPLIALKAMETINKIVKENVEEGNFTEVVPIDDRLATAESHSEHQMD